MISLCGLEGLGLVAKALGIIVVIIRRIVAIVIVVAWV